jgi:5'-phosphate synthase pdxT subunit
MSQPVIGILALQGDFEAHQKVLEERLHARTALIRKPQELREVHALILPGGESTTIGKLLRISGLDDAIQERARQGMPIYGTCAGLILMAARVAGSDQICLGLLNIEVERNAFGRQLDSFEAAIPMTAIAEPEVLGVFIRAPHVSQAGEGVEILGRYEDRIVAVRQGNLLGTAFHPELTTDTRLHEWLVEEATKFAE